MINLDYFYSWSIKKTHLKKLKTELEYKLIYVSSFIFSVNKYYELKRQLVSVN